MIQNFSAGQVFYNSQFGLQRVYQTLSTDLKKGLSKEGIKKDGLYYNDYSFANYLTTNFSKIDTNNDEKIQAEEMDDLYSRINYQGLTYNEILSLSANGAQGMDTSLLSTILGKFNEIDKDFDGKVSMMEVNAYFRNQEVEKKELELADVKAKDMSVFYADESTQSKGSLLDYKYQNTKS